MNILKKINLLVVAFASFFTLIIGVPAVCLAAAPATTAPAAVDPNSPVGKVCEGVNAGGTCADNDVPAVAKTIINILSWVVGIIAIIMIIFAGLTMVTSAGEAEKTKKAKSTITYALVGMVIVLLAQVIIRFVIKQVG